jgi:hypothetical protein
LSVAYTEYISPVGRGARQFNPEGAWSQYATMNTYQIARSGRRFQVIETLPGKGTFEIVGFPTETDARIWLDDYLRELGVPARPINGLIQISARPIQQPPLP